MLRIIRYLYTPNMQKIKKIASLIGNYLPTLLIISGIVFFVRLPWAAGESGIFSILLILVLSISIIAGSALILKSFASDKNSQSSGIFNTISNKFGNTLGALVGTILFVGFSLFIGLILLGFSEMSLSYFNFDLSALKIKIFGTIFLLIFTVLAVFLKKYLYNFRYIIAAIVIIALLSIVFGYSRHELSPFSEQSSNRFSFVSFTVILSLFFTAFSSSEIGLSFCDNSIKSDKSRFWGLIVSLVISLIIFIFFVLFYSASVFNDALTQDPRIIFDISLIPFIVYIAIFVISIFSLSIGFSETERTYSGISETKLLSNFLREKKQTGFSIKALIISFSIAEIGILTGDFNRIAEYISVLFLATYTFIYLLGFFQNRKNTKLHHSFNYLKYISIFGASLSFLVMLLINWNATLLIVIFSILIFIALKLRELRFENSNLIAGFKALMIKLSIKNSTKNTLSSHSFLPNILLFTTESELFSDIPELGKSIAGRLGILSKIVLKENSANEVVSIVSSKNTSQIDKKIFTKEFQCQNFFNGIDTIASTYGFSGLEPNTAMIGLNSVTSNVNRFSETLQKLKAQNFCSILHSGFEKADISEKNSIDFWWNSEGKNLVFGIALLKLLRASEERKNAKIRICVINDKGNNTDKIRNGISKICTENNIECSVIIVENTLEKRDKFQIIETESQNVNLLILENEKNFISSPEQTFQHYQNLALKSENLMIIEAANDFEAIDTELIFEHEKPIQLENISSDFVDIKPDLSSIKSNFVRNFLNDIFHAVSPLYVEYLENTTQKNNAIFTDFISKIYTEIQGITTQKEINLFCEKIKQILVTAEVNYFAPAQENITAGLSELEQNVENFISNLKNNLSLDFGFETKKVNLKDAAEYYLNYNLFDKFLQLLKNQISRQSDLLLLFQKQIQEKIKNIDNSSNLNADLQNEISACMAEFTNPNDFENQKKQVIRLIANSVEELAADISTKKKGKELKKRFEKKYDVLKQKHDLKKFGKSHIEILKLINNNHIVDLSVEILKYQLVERNEHFIEKISEHWNEKFITKISLLKTEIINSQQQQIFNPIHIDFSQIYSAISPVFQTDFHNFKDTLATIPEHMELKVSVNTILSEQSENVELRKIIDSIIQSKFYDTLLSYFETTDKKINTDIIEFQNVFRLYHFNIENSEKLGSESQQILLKTAVELQNRMELFLNNISQITLHIQQKQSDLTENTFDNLNAYTILRQWQQNFSVLSTQNRQNFKNAVKRKTQILQKIISNQLTKWIYKKSEGFIVSQKIMSKSQADNVILNISEAVAKVSPSDNVLKNLSTSYKNLFNPQYSVSSDFIVSHPHELLKAEKGIEIFNRHTGGGLLFIGEPLSGTTTMALQSAHLFANDKKLIKIFPPEAGSIRPKDFEKRLSQALGGSSDADKNLTNQTEPLVLLFDSVELWWARCENGFAIIDRITDLIEKHGKRHLFILTCNIFTYNFLNQYKSLDKYFNALLECEPMSSEKLQKMILTRHQTGAYKFIFNNIHENELGNIKQAALFDSIFRFSHGNAGFALYSWISHIKKSKNEQLNIFSPSVPNLIALELLDEDNLIYLVQFVLHKNFDLEKFSKIFNFSAEKGLSELDFLTRTGLIIKDREIYKLNPYFSEFLIKYLNRLEMI